VVAVGGDGTLHQVVQGFFQDGVNMFPSAFLGFVPSGTGCDFRRGLGWGMDLEESAKRLLDPKVREPRPVLVPQRTCPDGGEVESVRMTWVSGWVLWQGRGRLCVSACALLSLSGSTGNHLRSCFAVASHVM
jgi:hypothetical protein